MITIDIRCDCGQEWSFAFEGVLAEPHCDVARLRDTVAYLAHHLLTTGHTIKSVATGTK